MSDFVYEPLGEADHACIKALTEMKSVSEVLWKAHIEKLCIPEGMLLPKSLTDAEMSERKEGK